MKLLVGIVLILFGSIISLSLINPIEELEEQCELGYIEALIINEHNEIYHYHKNDTSNFYVLHKTVHNDTLFLNCFRINSFGFLSYGLRCMNYSSLDYCSNDMSDVVLVTSNADSIKLITEAFLESTIGKEFIRSIDTNEILEKQYQGYVQSRQKGYHEREFDTTIVLNSYFGAMNMVSLHVDMLSYCIVRGEIVERKYF